MKLSQEEKSVIEEIRNLSGTSNGDVIKILRALMYVTVMNYSEGEDIIVPYFGKFKIEYDGDEITEKGRIARLNTSYSPSEEVKLNIGMLEDVIRMGGDITEVPIIKGMTKTIENKLQSIIEE